MCRFVALLFFLLAPAVVASVRIQLTPEEIAYLNQLGPITVAPDPDWQPFTYLNEQGEFAGIAIDLLSLLEERLGIQFTYVKTEDWDEAVALSQAGKVLILPFSNQTPAREEWLIFTEPLLVDPNVFVTREEHPFISDASQLVNQMIVFPHGTSMEERVRRVFPNLTVVNVASEDEVFRAVDRREADMTLRSLTMAAYTIRREGLFNLKIAGQAPDLFVNRLRMCILKSEPELRDILNKGVVTITASDRKEIVNRHVNITIVTPMDYGFILRITGLLALFIVVSFYWNLRLKASRRALEESERSKSVLLANLPGMAYRCLFDKNWTMEFVSEGCRELTGYKSGDLIYNRRISYAQIIHPEDRKWISEKWEQARTSSLPVQLEYRIITRGGTQKWVYEKGIIMRDAKNSIEAVEGLIVDITARKTVEDELYHISIHDQLTGVHNRRYIIQRLQTLGQEYSREGKMFALAIIDLDHFKNINDTYGHQAGDYVLKEFGRILRESCRPYDLAGRFGGEEFVIIFLNIDKHSASAILERTRESIINHDFDFSGIKIDVRFSAGIASASESGSVFSKEEIIKKADDRLYIAKRQGRDRIIVCDEEMVS